MIEINYYRLGRCWQCLIPQKLRGFTLPSPRGQDWKIHLKNGPEIEAILLPSTRITAKIIILHFRAANSKMRRNQIVLPSMVGSENFHDLLLFLKTH